LLFFKRVFFQVFNIFSSKYLFISPIPEIDPETELAADKSQIISMQNDLEKWLHNLQIRPDILGSEEFQDFLNLSEPGDVELRICKHVFFLLVIVLK